MLRNPDISQPFLIHTDSSKSSLSAVLSQEFDKEEELIFYMSRKLIPAEWGYAAVEQEALAIIWAMEELQYYLPTAE